MASYVENKEWYEKDKIFKNASLVMLNNFNYHHLFAKTIVLKTAIKWYIYWKLTE